MIDIINQEVDTCREIFAIHDKTLMEMGYDDGLDIWTYIIDPWFNKSSDLDSRITVGLVEYLFVKIGENHCDELLDKVISVMEE